MTIPTSQDSNLGTWKSLPYQITLYTSGENLCAQATSNAPSLYFQSNQIKWGIKGEELPQQSLIYKIKSLSPEKIAVFHYPKENPTELWMFESTRMVGLQIREGKEYLIQALYEKALANFETALKLQQKVNGNTLELRQTISQIRNKRDVLRCNQYSLLYLPRDEEIEKFKKAVNLYEECIFESFEELLSIEDDFSPHHHLMSALVHEEKREFLLALEDYLNLSENNSRGLACFEKAYALLDLAQPPDLLNIKESIRIAFEKRLRELSQQEKAPTCFICFNTSEKDVGEWLEKTLVPDLDLTGIKPIFCYKDLSQGQDLDNFQELARNADLVIVACTPDLKAKYEERKKAPVGVAQEIRMIKGRYNNEDKAHTIFPIYLKGTCKESLPTAYFESVFGAKFSPFNGKDESFEFNYFSNAFDLFSAMRSVSRDISRRTREEFLAEAKQILKGKYNVEELTQWREEKTKRIQVLQETISHRISTHTQMVNLPLPPKDFIGREKELTDLHEACRSGYRVAVTGLGGMGKTALVLKYGENYKSHYQFIHFMPAGTPELAVDGLLRLADDLHIPKSKNVEERLRWLKIKLDQFEREYLLIFDGMDQIEVFHKVDKYLPERGRCLLLTSRMPHQAHLRNFEVIKLERFSIKEAVDYLQRVTGSKENQEAECLAQILGCLPLALKHAAGYIRSREAYTIQGYIEEWNKLKLYLFEEALLDLTKDETTILKTWEISLREIEKVAPFARTILELFAFMGEAPIPMKLIKGWFIDFYPAKEEHDLSNSLRWLCGYSMIGGLTTGVYEVHSLVQSVTRYQMSPDHQKHLFEQALQAIDHQIKLCKVEDTADWNYIKLCIPHAAALFENKLITINDLERHFQYLGEICLFFDNTALALRIQEKYIESIETQEQNSSNSAKDAGNYLILGRIYGKFGRYKKALTIFHKILKISKDAFTLATTHNEISALYDLIKDPSNVLIHSQQALEIALETFGMTNPLFIAVIYNNIACGYSTLGAYPQALTYCLLGLGIRLDLLSENHPDIAQSYANLGNIYKCLGNYKEALELYEKSLDMYLSLGKNLEAANAYHNLGNLYLDFRKYDLALDFFKKFMQIKRVFLSEDDLDLAPTYHSMAVAYHELGKYPKALLFSDKALQINLPFLTKYPFEIIAGYTQQGLIFWKLGHTDKALELHKKALELQLNSGEKKSFLAQIYTNIGLVYVTLKQPDKALKFFKKSLCNGLITLNPIHPEMALIYKNLGTCYIANKKFQKGIEFLQKSFKIERQVLGKNHLDVAQNYTLLGEIYLELEEYKNALKFFQKALKTHLRNFDENHISLANCYEKIAITHLQLKQDEDAFNFFQKVLQINIQALGENHPDVGATLNRLIKLYRDLRGPRESVVFSQKIIMTMVPSLEVDYLHNGMLSLLDQNEDISAQLESIIGTPPPNESENALFIAANYVNREAPRQMQESLVLLQKALQILQTFYEKNDMPLEISQNSIFSNLSTFFGTLLGLSCFQKLIEPELHDPMTAQIYHDIRLIFSACEFIYLGVLMKFRKNLHLLEKACEIFTNLYGEDHPYVTHTRTKIAFLNLFIGSFYLSLLASVDQIEERPELNQL